MKKIILGVLALASVWSSAWATEKSFTSPDGKLTVVVDDTDGAAAYRVTLGTTEFGPSIDRHFGISGSDDGTLCLFLSIPFVRSRL